MKNFTKIFALAFVLTFGSSIVKAEGIILGDRTAPTCTSEKDGIILGDRDGIILGDRASGIVFGVAKTLEGIILGDRTKEEQCSEKTGILVSDRDGIILGD